ncbi:unnamed protein product [Albugo candida]|uniref:Uncharacterized protein n=1 Tax=Albugo candida TaxID=65357 RepID=A0A024GN71_9STRA|nr:unnamed protein product [Albugo candida]|eukprot:CCI47795.1 unnamed protein product [Albugo candida]
MSSRHALVVIDSVSFGATLSELRSTIISFHCSIKSALFDYISGIWREIAKAYGYYCMVFLVCQISSFYSIYWMRIQKLREGNITYRSTASTMRILQQASVFFSQLSTRHQMIHTMFDIALGKIVPYELHVFLCNKLTSRVLIFCSF